ncbi:metalloregulator ArsR/SmtB family transcription factor [Roseimicrobium sp. ORNL1]|uniref:metalloregulator ArsR/SmtB family transcription factor n=1 Tax=Roseimicrobium sp. ORNL1 TaxID=2711231 RepID=UPI0013E1DF73|nr:metalloregulator ArsR/SmtB family transcription factor [Roseimicrobium sp. ORNL1]QIF00017.1 winged helix-turn-helix transcriptional regulator [Roseimicrobium sp. ORNL1]
MLAFTALADPTRRRIVEMLAERERTAGEIVARFDMTAPAISQHLKLLREAGLVSVRADGQRRIHSLDQGGFSEMEAWIAKTKQFWEHRLDALEHTLRAEDEKKKKPRVKKK